MKQFCYLFFIAIMLVGLVGIEGAVSAEPSATITVAAGKVNIDASDGACSLLEALENANYFLAGQRHTDCTAGTHNGADIINLATGSLYVFPTHSDSSNVGSSITINGNSSTLDHSDYEFFDVKNDGSLTLNNMTIQGSNGPSSAVKSEGSLYVNNVVFQDNIRTIGSGGGVGVLFRAAGASAEFRSVTFRNNVADGAGGGLAIRLGVDGAVNEVLIDTVTFENNGFSAAVPGLMPLSGGGLYIRGDDFSPTLNAQIIDSTFSGNQAGGGAGLAVWANANVTLENSTIDGNTAAEAGGGFQVYEAVFSAENSTVSNNTVTDGVGGGFNNIGGNVTMRNSTISLNSAATGGGFRTSVFSGHNVPATTALEFVTLGLNSATSDGGGFVNEQPDSTSISTVTAKNSVLFGNTAPSGQTLNCLNEGGTISSLGYNLHDDAATSGCPFAASGDDTLVGSFNSHFVDTLSGSGTQTHQLRNGSAARNHIPLGTNGCLNGVTDQRGVLRNSGVGASHCDVGAYENTTGAIPTAVAISNQASFGHDSRGILVIVGLLIGLTALPLSAKIRGGLPVLP